MAKYKYWSEDYRIYISGKESALGNLTQGVDVTNLATDTFYDLGVLNVKEVYRMKRKVLVSNTAGSGPDAAYIQTHGYALESYEISGYMKNLDLLYFMCKNIATTGPAESIYTHTFDTSASDRLDRAPSFQILAKQLGRGDSPANHRLLNGVTIKAWSIELAQNDQVKISFTVHVRKELAGTALTNWPSENTEKIFGQEENESGFRLTKNGAAYDGKCLRWKISWDDGIVPTTVAGSGGLPDCMDYGARRIKIEFDWAEFDYSALYTDLTPSEDPTTLIDVEIDLIRTADEDEIKFTMDNVAAIQYPEDKGFAYEDYYRVSTYVVTMDPKQTSFMKIALKNSSATLLGG